jgi:NAD(P)H-nitrite reductase large subunit
MSDTMICRCEEIMESEVLAAIQAGARTLDDVKRRTRSGMGLCQGKTCQRMIARLLARELGCSPASIAPPSARPPTRPLPLSAFWEEISP